MTSVSTEHISKTPGVCGGKACIAGHRIRVMDIVALHHHWMRSPDEIVDAYPGITLADVYAALAYYFDNKAEIDAGFEEDRKWNEFGKTQPSKFKSLIAERQGLVSG